MGKNQLPTQLALSCSTCPASRRASSTSHSSSPCLGLDDDDDDDDDDDSDSDSDGDGGATSLGKRKGLSGFDTTFIPALKASAQERRQWTTWPSIPYFLEELANQGNLQGLGTQTYQFQKEHINIKRSMKQVKDHITAAEMKVLEKKGIGASIGEKTTSLKNTCNAIYIKARDDVLGKLGETESKKAKSTGAWTFLKMGNNIKKLEQQATVKGKAAALAKRKEGGGIFGGAGGSTGKGKGGDSDDDEDESDDDGGGGLT
jgi:hypothetical protein